MSLAAIVAAGATPYYMTAEEGQELAAKGFISVNPNARSPVNFNAFQVAITPTGMAEYQKSLAPSAPTPTPTVTSTVAKAFNVRTDIQPPTPKPGTEGKRDRKATYPFDTMGVNYSFHIPCTPDNPEPWKKIASSVSAANKKSHVPVQPQEMVAKTERVYHNNPDGSPILDADGKKTFTETTVMSPKTVATKNFKAFQVDVNDPEGPGCRIFRLL